MKLGSSLRRRRRSAPKQGRAAARSSDSSRLPRLVRLGAWLRAFRVWMGPLLGRRALALLGVLAVLGFWGGYVLSTRFFFPVPPPPGDLAPVPDLRGQTLAEAAGNLGSAGLILGLVDSLRHPSVAEGMILGQSPLPGQSSLVGDTVRVAMSTGPERRPVPDVTRLRADRARTVLEASGFSVRVDSVDSDIPLGGVVTMTPEAGTETVVPYEVYLRVSRGPPLVEVPLLLGLPQEQALSILEAVGLEVGEVETRFRFGRDQGLVVEQEPPATTLVEKGTRVRLVVGRRGL